MVGPGVVNVRRSHHRAARSLGAALLLASSVLGSVGAGTTVEAVAPRSQRVVMFTDSVGLGAEYALPRAFPAGWDVRVDGRPAEMVNELERNFVRPRLATNPEWFGDHVVIAAAYNAPYWDWPRLDREIDSLIDVLTAAGVKHVYWVTLREVDRRYVSASGWRQIQPYAWYFPTVNERLEAALARHPNLTLVDWAAAANRPGLTYDAIHLNPTGAELYSSLIRQAVDAATTRVADGSTTKVHVPGGEGYAAAAVNLTTTGPRTTGFLTLHPCTGAVPTVSMHNYRRAEVAAHSGVVALDGNGDFCVTAHSATNLIVDVTGLFPPGAGFGVVAPTRWLDTRSLPGRQPVPAGATVELDLDSVRARAGLVGDPAAVAVVATAVEASGPGYLRVTTCGSDADTSNVNFTDGSASPNLVILEPDPDGTICVFASTATHVIVDLFGVFEEGAEATAGAARRAFDSRTSGVRVAAGSETVIDVAGQGIDPASHGVILNITALGAVAPGYITAYPCAAGRPDASNLNVVPGRVAANAAVIAPDASGEICVFSFSELHLVVDVTGRIGAPFTGVTPRRALDTRR
jgi:hypothetical protein